MIHANNAKKTEKKILIFILTTFTSLKNLSLIIYNSFRNIINQKITVMFIPHSEKKVFNLRLNLFIVFLIPFITFIIILMISIFGINYFTKIWDYKQANLMVQTNEKKSREYQDMINKILESHSYFKNKMSLLLNQINSQELKSMLEENMNNSGGPMNKFDLSDKSEFDVEKFEVDNLLKDYQYSIMAFGEINKMAGTYNKLLKDMPFGAPLNCSYAITSAFGLRIHPIYKTLDMHTGLDLASSLGYGTPILATAPGIVEKVEWDPSGYGWYCKLSHELGFSTLYGHMCSQPIVRPGDKVRKGQCIGYMGQTGAATGVHVHYEIRLGDNLLDPIKFVSN